MFKFYIDEDSNGGFFLFKKSDKIKDYKDIKPSQQSTFFVGDLDQFREIDKDEKFPLEVAICDKSKVLPISKFKLNDIVYTIHEGEIFKTRIDEIAYVINKSGHRILYNLEALASLEYEHGKRVSMTPRIHSLNQSKKAEEIFTLNELRNDFKKVLIEIDLSEE